MVSLTHFHSRNVYFYLYYNNSLKVTALDMFKTFGFTPPLKMGAIIKIFWTISQFLSTNGENSHVYDAKYDDKKHT